MNPAYHFATGPFGRAITCKCPIHGYIADNDGRLHHADRETAEAAWEAHLKTHGGGR